MREGYELKAYAPQAKSAQERPDSHITPYRGGNKRGCRMALLVFVGMPSKRLESVTQEQKLTAKNKQNNNY
jgi:hypothetical protein